MSNVDVNKNTDTFSSLDSFSGDSAFESALDSHVEKDFDFSSSASPTTLRSENDKIDLITASRQSCESDSICSDEGICSNTFEKLKKNDTLTRQKQNVQCSFILRNPNGLKGLVIWNNGLTKSCGQYISQLLETNVTLDLLNIGKNSLGNDFLAKIEESLVLNKSLSNLGLQSGHLSCQGIKKLANALQNSGNQTLKRIDLRDNFLKVECINALIDMLRSTNNAVKQIDLDEIPKRATVVEDIENDYYLLLQKVKSLCLERSSSNNKTEIPNLTNRGVYSLTTRKISLTCDNSSFRYFNRENSTPLQIAGRRNGDRLRSPVPSPPSRSPNSSPVPSPSRSRFHVSRVSESDSPGSSSECQLSPNSRFFVVRVPNIEAIKSPTPISTPKSLVPINISNTDAAAVQAKCTKQENNIETTEANAEFVLSKDSHTNSLINNTKEEKLEFLFDTEIQNSSGTMYKNVEKNDVIEQTNSSE